MNKLTLKDLIEIEAMSKGRSSYTFNELIKNLSEKDENGESGLKRKLRYLRDLNKAVDRIEEELEKDLE